MDWTQISVLICINVAILVGFTMVIILKINKICKNIKSIRCEIESIMNRLTENSARTDKLKEGNKWN